MNAAPNHEEIQELLPAAALEMLDGEELHRVLAHISACPECARLLEDYRAAAGALSLQPPAYPRDAGRAADLRASLLARARRERPGSLSGSRRSVSSVYRWSGWLVAASLASVLLVHHSIHRTLDYGWLVAGVLTFVLVAVGVYAIVQRNRAAALRERLSALERRPKR
jgi:anti-sigma factor RsiW